MVTFVEAIKLNDCMYESYFITLHYILYLLKASGFKDVVVCSIVFLNFREGKFGTLQNLNFCYNSSCECGKPHCLRILNIIQMLNHSEN
jgi:hypothetical protein